MSWAASPLSRRMSRLHVSAHGRFTVAKLVYSAITSLDGYIADEDGNFDWAAPDEEVHAFVNALERRSVPISTGAGCTR